MKKREKKFLIYIFCMVICVIGMSYFVIKINTSLKKTLTSSNMNVIAQGISEKIVSMGRVQEGDIPIPKLDINFKEHYAPDGNLVDGWNLPYEIAMKKRGNNLFIIIKSAGPDKLFGTKDDIRLEKEYSLKKEL